MYLSVYPLFVRLLHIATELGFIRVVSHPSVTSLFSHFNVTLFARLASMATRRYASVCIVAILISPYSPSQSYTHVLESLVYYTATGLSLPIPTHQLLSNNTLAPNTEDKRCNGE